MRAKLLVSATGRAGVIACLAILLCIANRAAAQAQPTTRPTLWIIGDSTVRNSHDTGDNGQWGWGNPIARFFDAGRVRVENRALGGTSSRTFRTKGLWDKVLAAMKPGDFVIMQFGHNDAGPLDDAARARGTIRGNGDETREIDNPITHQRETVHTYGWYLRQYVAEAKAKGAAEVIVCSPIPRNTWGADGKVKRNESYARPAADAAKAAGADFIDLNEIVAKRYDALGQEKVTQGDFPPNEHTHTNWAGAVLNARCVVEGLRGLAHAPLADDLLPNPPGDLTPPPQRTK